MCSWQWMQLEEIPDDIVLNNDHAQNEGIMGLIYNVYSEFIEQIVDYSYLQERVILAPNKWRCR